MAKYLKEFSTTAEYESYINNSPTLPNVSLTLDDNVVHYNKYIDYSKEYLTFEALQNGTFKLTVPDTVNANYMTSISYSIDDGASWTTTAIIYGYQTITTPTINAGDKVLWKGEGKAMSADTLNKFSQFNGTICNVSGNIMSLLYGDNFVNQSSFPSGSTITFCNLFKSFTGIRDASNLILPATTLVQNCYQGMFNDCTGLTTAPELPATTLAQQCYNAMFVSCRSLTTAPELPATTLANYCYAAMFAGCTNLNSVKMLATDISASQSLYNWVNNVAATGTFTKAASMTTLPTGASGIPSGWTVIDA